MEPTVQIVVHPQKGMIAAVLMPLFFGPIGLLYSCFWAAIVMSLLFLLALSSNGQGGSVAAVFIWVFDIYLSAFFVRRSNNKLIKKLKVQPNPPKEALKTP